MENENMKVKNLYLNEFACKDEDAIYLSEIVPDMRTAYFRDTDRILYSLAFNISNWSGLYLSKNVIGTPIGPS